MSAYFDIRMDFWYMSVVMSSFRPKAAFLPYIYFQPRIEGNFDLNAKLSMFPSQFDNKLTGGNEA